MTLGSPNNLNAQAQKRIDQICEQDLRDCIVAGLHTEGGWVVRSLVVEKLNRSNAYKVSFIAEERDDA